MRIRIYLQECSAHSVGRLDPTARSEVLTSVSFSSTLSSSRTLASNPSTGEILLYAEILTLLLDNADPTSQSLAYISDGSRLNPAGKIMTDELTQSGRRKAHNIVTIKSRKKSMENMSKYYNESNTLRGGRIWLLDNVEVGSFSYCTILNVRQIVKRCAESGRGLTKLWAPGRDLHHVRYTEKSLENV